MNAPSEKENSDEGHQKRLKHIVVRLIRRRVVAGGKQKDIQVAQHPHAVKDLVPQDIKFRALFVCFSAPSRSWYLFL
jgi:hypothetical protein